MAEPDRALTTVGTLLKLYGRFAIDASEPGAQLRGRCEQWAQRLLLGEPRSGEPAPDAAAPPRLGRDFRGVERFFEEARRRETEFVTATLLGLRRAVFALARALSSSIGEARDADEQLEARTQALSRALDAGDVDAIQRSASALIEAARAGASQRREREARQAFQLDAELRELREQLADEQHAASGDELTGLCGAAQYEQQLEQLAALGSLLAEPPWLLLVDVAAGRSGAPRAGPAPDSTLRHVGHCISRTFLRRQDFAARSGPSELAVLVVDMTQAEVLAAAERLLCAVRRAAADLSRHESPCVSIGVARFRSAEDPERWRCRARAAAQRAREDGGDGFMLGPG